MDQIKIGKFISELRKKKGLTQVELAERIGVTDRSVSKWENGRGMMDISFLVPLSEELGVSLNELLSGEELNDKNFKKKSEENLLNTIRENAKKLSRGKKILIVVFAILVVVFSVFACFLIDVNRMRNNKSVIFSTWGFDYVVPVNSRDERVKESIRDYRLDVRDSENWQDFGKCFLDMEIFLIEEDSGVVRAYTWILEKRLYVEGGEIKEDSGSSIPYKYVLEKVNGEYIVKSEEMPRDGGYYEKDIDRLFPSSIRRKVYDTVVNGTVDKLSRSVDYQAKLYYHID